jgi:uncharacterized protein YajQ (UPF0234 family)
VHVKLRKGLDDVAAKKIAKFIRDTFPKVKAQIQGEAVRVTGKSRDELQEVMTSLKDLDVERPLQFENYR